MAERVASVRLRAIVDQYEQAMGRAALATDKVAKTGRQMESVGRKMTLGFSVPMAAAGGFALKAASDYESAFAGVQKTVDGTAAEMAGLRDGIVSMANELPSSREEIAGVAEAAGQLGISTPNILGFTRTMIDLGNATDIAANDAAMSLAQLANITQMPQSEFSNLGSSVVELGNNLATTESRIVDMSQRIASAGTAVGLTESEILAIGAALSSVGIEAEAGGSAISRVMINIAQAVSAGGDELERWAAVAGVSSDQFAQMWQTDAAGAIAQVVAGLGDVAASGQDLFGIMEELGATDIRVGNALRSLAGSGDLLDRSLRLSSDAWDENTALAEEAGQRYATTESQITMAWNRITDAARQAGEVMIPAVHGVLNLVEPLASGAGSLVQGFAALPTPLQAAAGSMVALAVASGPTIWAMGKLASLYGPAIDALVRFNPARAIAGIRNWATGVWGAVGAMRAAAVTGTGMRAAMMGLGAAIGPQVALVAAIAAVAGAMYLAKRRADDYARSHRTAADSATALAESANLELQTLGSVEEGTNQAIVSMDDFRRANSDAISSIKELGDVAAQQSYIAEIGYQLVLRGATPEQAFEQVQKLADATGVTLPVWLDVHTIGDWEHQLDAVRARIAEVVREQEGMTNLTGSSEANLDAVAQAAADAWKTGNIEGFVQILATAEEQLGDDTIAINRLADEAGKLTELEGLDLSGIGGITGNANNTVDVLQQIASGSTDATIAQEEFAQSILDTAAAMEGGLTEENILAATGEVAADTARRYGAAVRESTGETEAGTGAVDQYGNALETGAGAGEKFAQAVEGIGGKVSLASIDFDAGAAAAEAFAGALDQTTMVGDRLGAGLKAGKALRGLREGMTGEQAIADIMDDAAKSTDSAADAVDRLSDVARRSGSRLSGLEMRLGTLSAAAEGFRKSIETSTQVDDQIRSAMSLGDAYRAFEKSYRRLPHNIDMVALATGKLRPRTAAAVESMLDLGKAATDYLSTMIEMGRTHGEVQGEAGRMRDEYSEMFRQMGMNEDQIRAYIEAMGLLPEQITTAIKVSGLEAAKFQLSTYIDLLDGRIPSELATSVIAALEVGDVEGAASMLADFARSNPALIEVGVDEKSVTDTEDRVREVRDGLWDLPGDFDPLKAALGEYTDEQMAALDAVMQFGDGVQDYLSRVAHDGNAEEIRDQALAIRDAFLEQLAAFGITGDAAQEYLELIGLSDWQIDSAINLSGDAEAIFRLETYAQFLADEIPPEVATEVLALVDEGNLQAAADRLAQWRIEQQAAAQADAIQVRVEALDPFGWLGGGPRPGDGSVSRWPTPFLPRRARGGLIDGPGTDTSDSIPAMLSAGEFVMRAEAVRVIGPEVLAQWNADPRHFGVNERPARFATGGLVTRTPRAAAAVARSAPEAGVAVLADRLRSIESAIGGIPTSGDSFGDITVVSPSPEQVPRKFVQQVGIKRRLG